LKVFVGYLIVMNIVTFITYGIDKLKSIKKRWRISEFTLIALSFFGGSLGALLGMQIFRHKTKHLKFKILLPLFLCIHVLVLVKIL